MTTAALDRPANGGNRPQIVEARALLEPTQYLTFVLAGEVFAIGIQTIKEILEYQGLTEVPMMPACVRGVINLRGAAVPVMDLLTRFGKPSSPIGKRTCIVIVQVAAGADRQEIGIIVDAVNEVLDIASAEIEPPPAVGTGMRSDLIQGIGKVNGKFVIVLDLDHVLSLDQAALAPPTIGPQSRIPVVP